jgi:hypothetical protein
MGWTHEELLPLDLRERSVGGTAGHDANSKFARSVLPGAGGGWAIFDDGAGIGSGEVASSNLLPLPVVESERADPGDSLSAHGRAPNGSDSGGTDALNRRGMRAHCGQLGQAPLPKPTFWEGRYIQVDRTEGCRSATQAGWRLG